jgi:PBSX family phage terminase large subunit
MPTIDLNKCFPESPTGDRGPLPKQRQFMDSCFNEKGPAYILYSGGVGSGKTLIGCISVLTMAFLHSGDYLVCRLFNPELKLTTYKTFLEICPKELIAEHRVADQIIKIKSVDGGISNVIFRGLEEPDKHRSLNLNAAYIDEASQVSEEAFTLLQSRLRGKHYRKILCTTNPNGHSWLYRYWIKKDFGNDNAKRQFFSVHAPSVENIHLPDGYVQNMLDSWSDERIKREVMGSWDAFQGQVYTEFERSKHVIKPFVIPKEWTRFIGLDHGYRNPAAAIFCAMDYDGNIYVYREFYQNEWIIEEIVKGRKGIGPGLVDLIGEEKIEGIWIDPSTKANRGKDSDFTTYLDYLPQKYALIPANNEVSNGIDRVKQLLKLDSKTKQPRIFFFDTCVNVIEQMAQYRYQELTPGQELDKNIKEEPVKKDDHAVDALRYAIMSRPEEPKIADLREKKRQEPTLSGSVQRELHELKQKGKTYDIFKDYEYGKDTFYEDPF